MVIRRHEDRQKATLLVLNIFSEKIFSCGFGIYRGRLPLGTDVWRLGAAPLPAEKCRHASYSKVSSPERRSEEHTSELQSLMRISYAVFCLKKKNKHQKQMTHHVIDTT